MCFRKLLEILLPYNLINICYNWGPKTVIGVQCGTNNSLTEQDDYFPMYDSDRDSDKSLNVATRVNESYYDTSLWCLELFCL